ncbi:MAG TPA: C25 family cysteine peptidase [Puia sp.]|nr:C25 family cysteine peptidase [Puia sp.]
MKTFFTGLLLLMTMGLAAQSYNNEWIDFSKTYFKFKVGSDGLYRIPQSVLASPGVGLGNVPVQNFQLYRNGQEVPIYTSVSSGTLGPSDYIEFWGKMNDGAPDQVLYRSPTYQHTKHWSLETDTATYFLTVNNTGAAFHFNNTTNDTTTTTLPVEPYFMHKQGTYFKTNINPGFAQVVGEYIYSSSYDLGEFWSTGLIYSTNPVSDAQNNLFVYTGGPDATMSFGAMGAADYNRTMRVTLNGSVLIDTAVVSFNDMNVTKPVPVSLLSSNTANVQFINTSATADDRYVASYYELNYPRQFNFGGRPNFYFELPARSAGYFLKINNLAVTGGNTPVLYDLTNGLRYSAIVGPGSTLSFVLAGSASSRRLVLVNEDPSTVNVISSLTPRTFTNYALSANQGNYIIISHSSLFTGSHGNNPVADYASYRSSPAGGSFSPHIYDIDELVDQFAFGIKKHPLSIMNFLRYARAKFAGKPQYVFLIGHGMTYVDYNTYADQYHDPLADKLNLVPTFGYPASDNKLSAANVLDAVPVTPIGRLSVVLGSEIETYLDKIKQYELTQATAPNTVDGRLWMKNVLHLTGVSEPFLGTILCNYMYSYKDIISGSLYGANVSTLCDGNAGSVTQVPLGLISGLFSNGFSIMNYFGHSTNTSLGYNLDDPSGYNNPGKYPIFYLNGCDAGDFFVYDAYRFTSSETISEKYVLAKDRGAAAVIASTHFGIVNYLNLLLYGLYTLIDQTDYGKPIGIIQQDALQGLINVAPGDYFARLHSEEMTTHGDPYLKLNQGALPDYDIEAPQVVINPSFIAISNSNFTINAKFYNLGKVSSDSVTILIRQKYPNGTVATLLSKKIPGIAYSDSVQLVVPINADRDKGPNEITVSINSDNSVTETTYDNNTVTSSFYVFENEATPIYPYNYAIINTPTSKLYASTADPLSATQQFAVEIDTTAAFNSTSKITKTFSSAGGILEIDPGITFQDSVVYYWRIAIVPAAGGAYIWNMSSFVYIDPLHSGVGYNQSHYFQHQASTPTIMYLDSASRLWKFPNHLNNLYIRNTTYPDGAGASTDQGFSTNVNEGQFTVGPGCGYDEIIFNVYDSVTFRPWANDYSGPTGLYGSKRSTCGPNRGYNFEFNLNTSATRKQAMDFLDMLPVGAYIEVRNNDNPDPAGNTYPLAWAADTVLFGLHNSLYHRFYDAGVTFLDSFTKPKAWAFVYQKGVSSFMPRFAISNDATDAIILTVDCPTPDTLGSVASPIFGPAKKWDKVHWRGSSLEWPATDSAIVQVVGIDTAGNKATLYNIDRSQQDFDISSVNVNQYPYLQMVLNTMDNHHGTPYQLRYWRIEDVPSPEGGLAPNLYLKVKDSVNQGEPLEFAIAFKDISPYAFDSMQLKVYIVDKSNVTHTILLPKKRPIASGDTLILDYIIDTKSYPGANTLYVAFNPDYAQPEQYFFNNFLYRKFYVRYEDRNPTLDVTFDNIHILNDDIVSAKPHIQIKLQTASQYLLLQDTSLITVQVQYPDKSLHPYHFNTDTLRFTPSTGGSDNTATVDFYPAFTTQYNQSGDDYVLIVSGKDALGNPAGAAPYRVGFTIINKPMISNMLNYPNPFTTSTAFVFTITGSEVPQNIKIQILTITGKIVREITSDELGPLHIGRNITEFKWNGTDMYGSRLANGVYLYHVVTNLNGKGLDKYKASGDNTDKYFNNGYGKMYLMR